MTEPAPPPDSVPGAPAVDLTAALSQMAGLVLSRETVDTALHLVTELAKTATAGPWGQPSPSSTSTASGHGRRPTTQRAGRRRCSTSWTRAPA